MNCVSCDICVYHLWFVFFPRVFLHSRVTRACPVTTDLIMRVNVRTTDGACPVSTHLMMRVNVRVTTAATTTKLLFLKLEI